MGITHVLRAEEHLPNTPKQQLLWEALGHPPPSWAHVPVLVNESRKKLSKRRDKVAFEAYRDEGYLADAMVNYLMTLGWAPKGDTEIVPWSVIEDEFRIEDVTHSPAFFDVKKLDRVQRRLHPRPIGRRLHRRLRAVDPGPLRPCPSSPASPPSCRAGPRRWPRCRPRSTSCSPCPSSTRRRGTRRWAAVGWQAARRRARRVRARRGTRRRWNVWREVSGRSAPSPSSPRVRWRRRHRADQRAAAVPRPAPARPRRDAAPAAGARGGCLASDDAAPTTRRRNHPAPPPGGGGRAGFAATAGSRPLRWVLSGIGLVVALAVGYYPITLFQVGRPGGATPRPRRPSSRDAAQYDGQPPPQLAARLDHVVALWRAGLAPLVVVSGGKRSGDRFMEAEASLYLEEPACPPRPSCSRIRAPTATSRCTPSPACSGSWPRRGPDRHRPLPRAAQQADRRAGRAHGARVTHAVQRRAGSATRSAASCAKPRALPSEGSSGSSTSDRYLPNRSVGSGVTGNTADSGSVVEGSIPSSPAPTPPPMRGRSSFGRKRLVQGCRPHAVTSGGVAMSMRPAASASRWASISSPQPRASRPARSRRVSADLEAARRRHGQRGVGLGADVGEPEPEQPSAQRPPQREVRRHAGRAAR